MDMDIISCTYKEACGHKIAYIAQESLLGLKPEEC